MITFRTNIVQLPITPYSAIAATLKLNEIDLRTSPEEELGSTGLNWRYCQDPYDIRRTEHVI